MDKIRALHSIKTSRLLQVTLIPVTLILIVLIYIAGHAIIAKCPADVRLVVYAFSTQEEVFNQGILPAFEKKWEAETGQELEIESIFDPSDTLAERINLGGPADVAILSNARHVRWFRIEKMIGKKNQPSIIGYTPMVIVTRPGNPYGIFSYPDLAQPKLRLLHADPRSSGAGEWSLLAEYGSALLETSDPAIAEAQLQAIWDNVRLLGPSARATLTLFELRCRRRCDHLRTGRPPGSGARRPAGDHIATTHDYRPTYRFGRRRKYYTLRAASRPIFHGLSLERRRAADSWSLSHATGNRYL